MTLQEFVRENKEGINRAIDRAAGRPGTDRRKLQNRTLTNQDADNLTEILSWMEEWLTGFQATLAENTEANLRTDQQPY